MEEKNRKNFINKMAHVVRVVTIPPLMIATLLCMLYFANISQKGSHLLPGLI